MNVYTSLWKLHCLIILFSIYIYIYFFFYAGAEIDAQTIDTQETALSIACQNNFFDIVQFLLNHGAWLELGACTPLMVSAHEGNLRLVEYLLECGANVNSENILSETPLTYACRHGYKDISQVLIECGANVVSVFLIFLQRY